MSGEKFKVCFLHPKYWLSWLAVGLTWFLAMLSRSWQYKLSDWIANRLSHSQSRRTDVIKRNIELCFTEKDKSERNELVRANVQSSALMFFDLMNIIWREPAYITSTIQVIGEQHLYNALSNNKPLLLVTAHFTPLFQVVSYLSSITSFSAVYRRMNNPVLEEHIYQRAVKKYPITLFHRKDIRNMLEHLADNSVTFIAPDQDFGINRGVFLPFFGIQTATITTIPQYARQAKAQTMMFSSHRKTNGQCVIEFEPVLENFPSGNDVADTQRWSDWLEGKIRQHPTDYFWMHKRFKSRPDGEAGFYNKGTK